jgi:hypothetical protein
MRHLNGAAKMGNAHLRGRGCGRPRRTGTPGTARTTATCEKRHARGCTDEERRAGVHGRGATRAGGGGRLRRELYAAAPLPGDGGGGGKQNRRIGEGERGGKVGEKLEIRGSFDTYFFQNSFSWCGSWMR